jgi:hypothetical protein
MTSMDNVDVARGRAGTTSELSGPRSDKKRGARICGYRPSHHRWVGWDSDRGDRPMNDAHDRTMHSLEERSAHDSGTCALNEWYRSIHDIPLRDLPLGDIARSCRQDLFLDHLVPVAIRHLEENPLAGDMYDGELLASLRNVATEFWRQREDLKSKLAAILGRLSESDLDVEANVDVEVIRRNANIH